MPAVSQTDVDSPSRRERSNERRRQRTEAFLSGFALGFFTWKAVELTGIRDVIPVLRHHDFAPAAGLFGAFLGLTAFRRVILLCSLLMIVLILTMTETPILLNPVQKLIESDNLVQCDAVVPLSSEVLTNGVIGGRQEDRYLEAIRLIHLGYAPRMIITRMAPPYPSALPDLQREISSLGLTPFPISEVGPIENTHEEAQAVTQLCKQHGWKKILLVTSPLHTRRAAATFRRMGLQIVVQPSLERDFDLKTLNTPDDRMAVFPAWLREVIGWRVYQYRGWI